MKEYYTPKLLEEASAALERMREQELAEHREAVAMLCKAIPEKQTGEEKIKTRFARIVVGGTPEKPFYEIMYFDPGDDEFHLGYGSFELKFVFGWMKEFFEVAGGNAPYPF